MSMFSIHYLIYRTADKKFWNGGDWSDGGGVRFHDKGSAEAVLRGVLANQPGLSIEEDE